MVKTINSLTNSGVSDWLLQRVSAIILAAYIIFISTFLILNSFNINIIPGLNSQHNLNHLNHLNYATWHGLFNILWVKIATVLFILALIIHAWIGIWTVLTDYIHCSILRNTLHFAFLIAYLVYLIWTINILWF